eukprot:1138786-Pelagomonas_calceolata.AAC.3
MLASALPGPTTGAVKQAVRCRPNQLAGPISLPAQLAGPISLPAQSACAAMLLLLLLLQMTQKQAMPCSG